MNDVDPRVLERPHTSVIVVGGGQAGLSMSWYLKSRGIDHIVLERHRIAHEWRERRWDSFCLVTPNWQCQLPGFPYAGGDPHGFMGRDDIVRYVEAYAASFGPPVREGIEVTSLRRGEGGGYAVTTSDGEFTCDQVVIAVGGYHVAVLPRFAERVPDHIVQMHSSQYRNPAQLPPGEVLVVGSGQSGCQIAEDLHLAGRQVHLATGGAPRTARFYRGRDVVDWLQDMGYYDMPVEQHPLKERVRAKANHYVTGRDGGHDIDLRRFALEGMRLYGRMTGVTGTMLTFADDLKRNLDQADAVSESIKTTIDKYIDASGIEAPAEPRYVPPWQPQTAPPALDVIDSNVTSIVWSMGYRADYRWIEVPVFDGKGYPTHQRGVTSAPGLYFLGLPWLHTWGSGRFSGIARDAGYLADRIAASLEARERATAGAAAMNELAFGS
jgi:putative flavoprotein involved in K+ transport